MDNKDAHAAQRDAADVLLDLGVSIPVRAPRLLRWLGKREMRLTIRRPYYGTMVRISKAWLSMGVTAESISRNSLEDDLKLIGEHGRTVANIVALGILRGKFSGHFAGLLARWLMWHMHPSLMVESAYRLVTLSKVEDFTTTIRLLGAMNVTRNLSPGREGS